jgi:hypothetical protein
MHFPWVSGPSPPGFRQRDEPLIDHLNLVPDLDDYSGVRGFLFLLPFTDSAPGPLVTMTAEVVAAVRDLPALHGEYAEHCRSSTSGSTT